MKSYVRSIRRSFSYRQTVLYYFFVTAFIVVLLIFAEIWNTRTMITVPAVGGELVEGIIGTPRFVNPILAVSDSDRDISTLVYSGLMKVGEDGKLVTDLAESFQISSDGMTYMFKLKKDAVFHDGQALTADDVVYTINRAQDPIVKSPRRASWEGVTTEAVDDEAIVFRLKQPFSGFLENTTIGILPEHLWKTSSSELFAFNDLNFNAVGSGPYEITKVKKDNKEVPTEYTLASFSRYVLGRPKISQIKLKFFASEENLFDALNNGNINSAGALSPMFIKYISPSMNRIVTAPLPRVFGVFFNQFQNKLFAKSEVRLALDAAIDKDKLIKNVLSGYGTAIDGPLPPGSLGYRSIIAKPATDSERILKAQAFLQKGGWKLDEKKGVMIFADKKEPLELKFTLTTVNSEELKGAAEFVASEWKKIGAEVTIKTLDLGDLNQNVIRPRNYDALLFGEIVGRDPDLFSFWHSSQRNDPGLNIAQYTNVQTDKILEKIRVQPDESKRLELIEQFSSAVNKDRPAVFLYSPVFLYVVPMDLKNMNLSSISISSDRFINVSEWYLSEEKIWPLFRKLTN
ncbi:MAG: hypothetical protein HZA95_01815 [Candidatus Vogelbacteria bacterium]|nr:hypothetical protein [Candidatus Vogelbacteria bacterium]